MGFNVSTLINIIIAALSLGFLIFWHELGHFLAAKRAGIRVEKFSIGFGPELFGFTRGETRYCLSVLFFGGYVKMPGENPEDETAGVEGEFSSASVEKRIFVAAAGPAMNVLFGICAYALIYMLGFSVARSNNTTEIGYVLPGYPAEVAGLQPGDRILSINGRKVREWQDVQERILVHPDEELELIIKRDGREQALLVTPRAHRAEIGEVGQLGITARTDVLVRAILPGSPAALSGLAIDDQITHVNGKRIFHREAILGSIESGAPTVTLTVKRGEKNFEVELPAEVWLRAVWLDEGTSDQNLGITSGDRLVLMEGQPVARRDDVVERAKQGTPFEMTFQREGGETYTVEVTPELDATTGEVTGLGGFWLAESFAGLQFGEPYDLQKYGVITAWGKGIEKSWETVVKTFAVLRDLIVGDVSPKYLSGPVGIVDLTARMVSSGWGAALHMLAFISVNLAVVNLLPIPIADGGQIVLFIMEKFNNGQPLSQRKRIFIQQVGVGLILVLFALVTWNDLVRIVRRFI